MIIFYHEALSTISDHRSFLSIDNFVHRQFLTIVEFRSSAISESEIFGDFYLLSLITYISDTFILLVIANEFVIIAFACLFILFLCAGLDNNDNQLGKMFPINVLFLNYTFAVFNIYHCNHLQENCELITRKVWTTRAPLESVDGLIKTNDNEVLLIIIIINRLFATYCRILQIKQISYQIIQIFEIR